MKTKSIVTILPTVLLLGILGFLLYWRMQVAMTRFFDVDEFTHLHWAANMARGQRPYIDFFTFFTPGFYWILAPLFWLVKSTELFPIARIIAFGIFLGNLAAVGILFALLRSKRWALIPVIILAFLPMPYDKFLELRPDNLATLLAMIGVIGEIWAIREIGGKRKNHMWWLVSGLAYSFSLIVLVKTLPFVVAGVLVAVWDSGILKSGVKGMIREIGEIWEKKEHIWFLVGLVGPLLVLLFYLLSLGDFGKVWYSLTRLAFEANTIGRVYIMEPHLFFFPNPAFYGGRWGITGPLITNHLIWTIAVFVGVIRFLTPFLSANGDIKRVRAEVLIGSIFVLSTVGYVNFFPLKHSQYLIPIAIFIAFYAADVIVILIRWIEKVGQAGVIGTIGVIGVIGVMQTIEVNTSKLGFSHDVQFEQFQKLIDTIPSDREILDMEGRMVFWKDPYDICCLPFGQFTGYLSQPPRPLRDVLEEKKVPYLFQGRTNRLWTLSNEDQWYIKRSYRPVAGWGEELWERL